MKQAFLILAHKNPIQLDKLVSYLLINDGLVLVHIDKKSLSEFKDFCNKYASDSRIRIYSKYKVYWGSFNQIQASHLLLEECLTHYKFDYVHLISGQDLPVKKLDELKKFLEKGNGKDFLHVFNSDKMNSWSDNGGLDRMQLFWITDYPDSLKFFFSKLNVLIHMFQRIFKFYRKLDFKINGGTNWFSLSQTTAKAVVSYVNSNPEFLNRFRNTRCADEIFLASVLLNAGLEENINSNYLRFIDWQSGPEYPRTFRIEDYERLKSVENVFFARKFDEKTDNFIIDKVYKELLA